MKTMFYENSVGQVEWLSDEERNAMKNKRPKVNLSIEDDEIQYKKIMLVYQAGIANVFEVACFNLASFGAGGAEALSGRL